MRKVTCQLCKQNVLENGKNDSLICAQQTMKSSLAVVNYSKSH